MSTSTALFVASLLCFSAVAVVAIVNAYRRPPVRHAATATAALLPDDPALPVSPDLALLDFAAEVMADIDDLPTTHEREYTK